MVEEGASYATAMAPSLGGNVGQRLQQLVAGWRGVERGQSVAALHEECTNAVGSPAHSFLPTRVLPISGLDATTLQTALAHLNGIGSRSPLTFRVVPTGRFDAALVPIGRAGEMPDRWALAIDADLAFQDQVALYAHVLGHLLLNRETIQMGRLPPLDPRDGYAHADMLGELRQIESTRSALDRRVVEAYPLLAELLQSHEQTTVPGLIPPDLKERLGEAGWRGYLVSSPYEFTTGRIYIRGTAIRRGPRLRADALLRAEASVPIALVNTLRPGETHKDAEQRLIEYAHERLRVPFAYLLEEDGTVHEFDWSTAAGSEPIRTTLKALPTREQLWARWTGALGLTDEKALSALRYPYQLGSGRTPRYYQDAAINRAIIAVLQAQRGLHPPRILLTMATGTGKTPVAFQIVWKLKRAHTIRNVLFLTDRDYLLGQAMDNHFTPFADARARIRGEANTSHDILFATYQAIADEQGRKNGLFRAYPRDFFSLIIVDECHRGSAEDESNWRAILEYFESAIQIGLTATPLRTDNVQTYEYFGNPVETYSLRLGITDGYLAPYRVRRVLIGAEPPNGERDLPGQVNSNTPPTDALESGTVTTSSALETVETRQALVDRTEVIAEHLAKHLKNTDPMAKTIIFCVDQAHAERMREALRAACPEHVERYPNDYVVRIVADEGEDGKRLLGRFSTPDEKTPVIVTTSKLLSTGVDVPTCKNIVLARPVTSIVEFKQIIGRGTRLYEPDKTWFTILDYAGATYHFFDPDFDGDPELVEVESLIPQPPVQVPETPQSAQQDGNGNAPNARSSGDGQGEPGSHPGVPSADTQEPPPNAYVGATPTPQFPVAPVGPTIPTSPAQVPAAGGMIGGLGGSAAVPGQGTAPEGTSTTAGHPPSPNAGPNHPKEARKPETPEEPKQKVPEPPAGAVPVVTRMLPNGNTLKVIGEIVYELGPDGTTLRVLQYSDFARSALTAICRTPTDLRAAWLRREQHDEIRARLEEEGVDLLALADTLHMPNADPLDLLLYVAFGQPPLTRHERADRLRREQASFFTRYGPAAREILETVLKKYVNGEAQDVSDPDLLKVPPLSQRGTFVELSQSFGGGEQVRAALKELQSLLYSA